MKFPRRQSGITLVVSLIMLVVLTLLVVSAIRFGNVNLRIAGNAQAEAEASAATQVALEQMLQEINTTEKVDTIAAKPSVIISTGGGTYTVSVSKPVCLLSKNITGDKLDYKKAADRPCMESSGRGGNMYVDDGTGNPTPLAKPSACKDQQWDIAATLNDTATGAKVEMLQGVALRVGSQVSCPT